MPDGTRKYVPINDPDPGAACDDQKGTPAGAARHRRAREDACPECREAHNAASAEYQANRRQDPKVRLRDRLVRDAHRRLVMAWVRTYHPEVYADFRVKALHAADQEIERREACP